MNANAPHRVLAAAIPKLGPKSAREVDLTLSEAAMSLNSHMKPKRQTIKNAW